MSTNIFYLDLADDDCWLIKNKTGYKVRIGWGEEAKKKAREEIKRLNKKADYKKPRVTKEWIEEKATYIYNLSYYKSFSPTQIADVLRSLVEEIQCVA